MTLVNQHLNIVAKNWKSGSVVFGISGLFLLPAIFVSKYYDVNPWWFVMSSLVLSAMAVAYFISETQKEYMSRGTGFLLPGLGSTVINIQIRSMLTHSLGVFLLAYFLPALAPVTAGNLLNSLTLSFLSMAVFTTTLWVVFLYKYSSWLSTFILLPFLLYIKLGKSADAVVYQNGLGESGILLISSAVITIAGLWFLAALNLPHRLAEQPFLSSLQIYKPAMVQNFKNRNAAHDQPKNQNDRPMKHFMDVCLEKASRARFAGNESQATIWDTTYLSLATGIPRGLLGAWNLAPFIIPFVLLVGYADSNNQCDSGMIGWFSAFPFMFATLPTVAFHYLGVGALGFPRSRATTEKAGYIFTAWIMLLVILLSILTFGVMHFLASVMPEFETATRVWSYHAPARFHTPFLPVLIMPVILFIYLLVPKSSAQMVLGGAGMQVFLLFNFAISGDEKGVVSLIFLGISLAAWVALPLLWRRKLRVCG